MNDSIAPPLESIPGVTVLTPGFNRTDAVRSAWAIREAEIAAGMRTMTLDEIAEEISRRRGGDADA